MLTLSSTKSKSTIQCRKEADVVGWIRRVLVRFDDVADGKTIQRQKSCLAYRPKVATQTSTFKPIVGKQIDRLLTGSDALKLCKTLNYIEIVRPCYLDRNKTLRYTCIVIFEIKRLKYINNWVLLLNYPTLSIHECQNPTEVNIYCHCRQNTQCVL